MTTAHQAKYFAAELLKRGASDSVERLAGALADAKVALNPHQIDAALFAFKSPISRGALLADEVGLGKTIEAGILLLQKWAEKKRRILLIMPASLRKQWSQELAEKFYLPAVILEARNFKSEIKGGILNPFDRNGQEIVICSYQFAAKREEHLMRVPWDLVVIDEAHRLRNVYKPDNVVGRTLRAALRNVPKVLLTATPLQNSLMELYGLVSFIDEYAFGDEKTFRSNFVRGDDPVALKELQERLRPFCHRTLRRQVVEYIRFTHRIPLTQDFVPSPDELKLYDEVSTYLQRTELHALPSSQRALMVLVLRKLLASSTFAIGGALDALARKLQAALDADTAAQTEAEEDLQEDFELLEELKDEEGFPEEDEDEFQPLTSEQRASIQAEIDELSGFRDLAVSITQNQKGEALLTALEKGFEGLAKNGALQKAIIFTESRRTQAYLLDRLASTPYAGKIVLFNGTNNDPKSREVYAQWTERWQGSDRISGSRSADMRQALVDYFRDEAQIMIATEAAAEGINLQFCSLVVNYDLPWNPQRIEQRIGRCHRYGQEHDVVVINFLNKKNAADQRVHELLDEKFRLFSGVFGASDDILGVIESGVDFEKRIIDIYQRCRHPDEIQSAFAQLQKDMDEKIQATMEDTRRKLLEHFDADVHERLRISLQQGQEYRNRFDQLLWRVTEAVLADRAAFFPSDHAFVIGSNPYPKCSESIPIGRYELNRDVEHAHRYRLHHALAGAVLAEAMATPTAATELIFKPSGREARSANLESLQGKSGTLAVQRLTVTTGDTSQDITLLVGQTADGATLTEKQIQRLLELPATAQALEPDSLAKNLDLDLNEASRLALVAVESRHTTYFDQERKKLDAWADDQISEVERSLKEAKTRIRDLRAQAGRSETLEEQARIQTEIAEWERKQRRLRQQIFDAEDEILKKRDLLLEDIREKLRQSTETLNLFAVNWTLSE